MIIAPAFKSLFVTVDSYGGTKLVKILLAQVVLIPVVHFRARQSDNENLYNYPMTISNRGDGALGSTDG